MTATTTPSATVRSGRPAPGPSKLASLRAVRELRSDILGWVHRHRLEYGDVFASRLPPIPGLPKMLLYVCEPDAARQVLTDSEGFAKGSPVYDEIAAALGDGLLTTQGAKWRGQRRTLQPLFTRRRIEGYTDAFLAAIGAVTDTWAGGGQVELVDEMEKVTLGSVSRALFGTDVTADVAPVVAATDALSYDVVARGMAPWRMPRWLPTPTNRRFATLEADLRGRTEKLVAAAAEHDGERDRDLVARLLEAEDPETGDRLDHREIIEQALIFLLAGYDTTSTALAFTLHELGARPELQEAIRDEIAEVVGDRTPTAADVGRLDLTGRSLHEGMRLHPPAYITSRSATRDTTIAGFDVPAGTVVTVPFAELHRHERFWVEPDRFDPDRFLPEQVEQRDRYAYLPFGGGPRSCIGEHFAVLEATLALAQILRRWRITTDGGQVPMRFAITQRAAAPVPATLTAV